MKQKQKRTHIIGALIFVTLVTIAGFGLVATGNFHNPLNIFGGDGDHPGGPGAPISQTASNNTGRGPHFSPQTTTLLAARALLMIVKVQEEVPMQAITTASPGIK
jgi:hypothetical protein